MSYNLFNMDIIRKKPEIKQNTYKISNKKLSEHNKNKKIISSMIFQKDIEKNLKNICENSLILLDILNQHTKKNMYKKYNLESSLFVDKNFHKIINASDKSSVKLLMKKKFLITPHHMF
ncbi:hypothetical protein ATN01_02910 [Buchnera aphidicola (Diuraphis noxia)]|uniref:Uncharacterized protein n=1 Tax=Buchnera aphidicola subsp. Diuraphis noxia TaxID=118101 RepID=A0A1B2H9H3_BUCDN|nr:hypothetical protein [Buchnera aphidicola]ANZ22759.1 hypothetical protein ATN01_02910 [Buchnera aphidicola (Diuraphis noxia)]